MDQGPPTPSKEQRISAAVTELLSILGYSTEPELSKKSRNNASSQKKALNALKQRFFRGDPIFTLPEQANAVEKQSAEKRRTLIQEQLKRLDGAPKLLEDPETVEKLKGGIDKASSWFAETRVRIDDREDRRRLMLAEIQRFVPDGVPAVPDATLLENNALAALRDQAVIRVKAASTLPELEKLDADVVAIADRRRKVEETARLLVARKLAVESELPQLLPPADARPDALAAEHAKVALAFATPPYDEAAVLAGEKALQELKDARGRLESAMTRLRSRRGQLEAQLKSVIDGMARLADARSIAAVQNACEKVEKTLPDRQKQLLDIPLTEDRLAEADRQIWYLRDEILNIAKSNISKPQVSGVLTEYIRGEASKLDAELNDIVDMRLDSLNDKIAQAKSLQLFFGQNIGGSGGQKTKAINALNDLRLMLAELRKTADGRLRNLLASKKLMEAELKTPDQDGIYDDYRKQLAALRAEVTKIFTAELDEAVFEAGSRKMAEFRDRFKLATADAKAAAEVQQAQGELAKILAGVLKSARSPAALELQRANDAAEKQASLSGANRDMVTAAKLYKSLLDRVKEVGQEAPPADALFTGVQIDKQPVSAEVIGRVKDMGGSALLADPATLRALCEAATLDPGKQVEALLMKGLGGEPQVFAAVAKRCGGQGLLALAKAFAGADADTARASLLELVDNGGLKDNPHALAALLQHGVNDVPDGDSETDKEAKRQARRNGNADKLKQLSAGFSGKDGPAALRTLLSGAGLGSSPVASAPPAIASLLHGGFDGDAAKLRQFADSMKDKPKEVADLNNLVNQGGVGHHPSVLGPLVKKSGADTLKEVGAAFAKPEDAANLKSLLDDGGMSGDTRTAGKQHEHPDTLAKVLADGFDGDADKLRAYALAFKGHAAQSKFILDAMNEWPDGKADRREPGKAFKKLLGPRKLNGNVAKLQSTFATEISKVTDDVRRKQAVRFAPHFAEQSAGDDRTIAGPNGAMKMTASVLKRHQPECFDRTKFNQVVAEGTTTHTQFPPGTDVPALVEQALKVLNTMSYPGNPPDIVVDGITVSVRFLNDSTVNHFHPVSNPGLVPPDEKETPDFTTADIKCLYAAIK